MKKIFLLLLIIIQFSCTRSMQENDVKAAIEGESLSFYTDSNRAKFLDFWGDSKDMRISYSSEDRTQNYVSVGELKAMVNKGLLPAATMAKSAYSNYVIKVSGSVAWAMFDQKTIVPEGSETYTHEFRCLEKINGKWKIIGSSIHQYNQ
jgi:hypothetical protein